MDVDELQEFLLAAFPDNPSTVRVEDVHERGVRLRLPVTAANSRPGGTVSGPSLMALADTGAWLSVLSRIGPVAMAVTTSLHIDFLRRPALVDVVAEATLVKLGRRLGVTDVAMWSVTESPDRLVAKALVTYSIPAG